MLKKGLRHFMVGTGRRVKGTISVKLGQTYHRVFEVNDIFI